MVTMHSEITTNYKLHRYTLTERDNHTTHSIITSTSLGGVNSVAFNTITNSKQTEE